MPKEISSDSALKNLFDQKLLERIAKAIRPHFSGFDQKSFIGLMAELKPLEMKPRVRFIRDELQKMLPQDFLKTLNILVKSANQGRLGGFDLWPYMEFIQTYGLQYPNESLEALKKLTPLFTAEWAIRPFIKENEKMTMAFLLKCTADTNVHIRRWACEGSRPRLPWGERLQNFVKNPRPTLPILESLKFDDQLYVRKSVANHLNDIAKDHPDFVIQVLQRWKKQAGQKHQKKMAWIIRHSLRTLIKQGHAGALSLIGVSTGVKIKVSKILLQKSKVKLGEKIYFEFNIISAANQSQKLVVDYLIHFVKSNNETSAKVFKLKTFELASKDQVTIKKSHSLKKITTREYYSGRHLLEIQVNGRIVGKMPWRLLVD